MASSFLGHGAIHRRSVCINLTGWSILLAAQSFNTQSVLFLKQICKFFSSNTGIFKTNSVTSVKSAPQRGTW